MKPHTTYKLTIVVVSLAVVTAVLLGTASGRRLLGVERVAVVRVAPKARALPDAPGLHLDPTLPDAVRAVRERLLPSDAPHPLDRMWSTWPDEQTTYRLRPVLRDHPRKVWHPVALDRPLAHDIYRLPWEEHPDGELFLVTNGLGMRRDGPVPAAATGPRVLVLGDSHTYGLVNNDEHFCHLLEQALARDAAPGARPEVLDAGCSSTGPFEQLGTWCAFQELRPDVVVLVLFTGNDFMNAVPFADYFAGREPAPWESLEVMQRHQTVQREHGTPVAQGFSQAYVFKHKPLEAQTGLLSTLNCLVELDRLTGLAGVPLVVAILDSKRDVEPHDDPVRADDILARLELTDDDYLVNRKLGLRLADALEASGIDVIQLTPHMTPRDGPYFWRHDFHLGLGGHAKVAEVLEAPVREAIATGR